ncbi:hypothetical protein ACTXT7_007125 [Hymenolepis weldensis]
MLPDCGLLRPPSECQVNVTLPWDPKQYLDTFVLNLLHVSVSLLGGSIVLVGILSNVLCILVFSQYHITLKITRRLLILNSVTDILYLTFLGCPTILIGLTRKDAVSTIARDCFYSLANKFREYNGGAVPLIQCISRESQITHLSRPEFIELSLRFWFCLPFSQFPFSQMEFFEFYKQWESVIARFIIFAISY